MQQQHVSDSRIMMATGNDTYRPPSSTGTSGHGGEAEKNYFAINAMILARGVGGFLSADGFPTRQRGRGGGG